MSCFLLAFLLRFLKSDIYLINSFAHLSTFWFPGIYECAGTCMNVIFFSLDAILDLLNTSS